MPFPSPRKDAIRKDQLSLPFQYEEAGLCVSTAQFPRRSPGDLNPGRASETPSTKRSEVRLDYNASEPLLDTVGGARFIKGQLFLLFEVAHAAGRRCPPVAAYGHWIGGEDHAPLLRRHLPVVSTRRPGRSGASSRWASKDDVAEAVAAAKAAFAKWRAISPTRRGRLLMRWADAIHANAEKIGRIETSQNGKLLNEMVLQARIVPDWLYYYGGLADKIEGRVIPLDRTSVLNYTLREPLGVVGVIMPWNSPLFLTIMAVAPALAAGNTVVIKPSEVTPASVIEAARLAEEAGIPAGVINVVTGDRATGEALIDHPDVAKIAFTGGVEAGRAVGAARRRAPRPCHAGARRQERQHRLPRRRHEAGGGRAARRHLRRRRPDLRRRLARARPPQGARQRARDPVEARRRHQDRRSARPGDADGPGRQQGRSSRRTRAWSTAPWPTARSWSIGGKRANPDGLPNGYFFSPTILSNVAPDSFIAQNEVFGPVLSVIPFEDEEEAIAIANGTQFGLAAGVWTLDIRRAHRMARQLQAGTVWINMYRAMAFNSPFGGYKSSGIGRQNGIEAMDQYLQTKSVWCELSDDVQDPFVMRS